MPKHTEKKDRDEITVAKSIFDEIVEFTELEPKEETPKETRARKGGQARAEKLSSRKRSEIAKKAAAARWKADPEAPASHLKDGLPCIKP